MEALFDKYADEGNVTTEDMNRLQINPLNHFISPLEIIELLGGKVKYQLALAELEKEIYKGVT